MFLGLVSLLRDPCGQLPEANGIYASGVYIGGAMASISEAIAVSVGWRVMMFITAGAGVLVGVALLLTATEPARQGVAPSAKPDDDGVKQVGCPLEQ